MFFFTFSLFRSVVISHRSRPAHDNPGARVPPFIRVTLHFTPKQTKFYFLSIKNDGVPRDQQPERQMNDANARETNQKRTEEMDREASTSSTMNHGSNRLKVSESSAREHQENVREKDCLHQLQKQQTIAVTQSSSMRAATSSVIQKQHMREKEYLSQLRKQQAAGADPGPSRRDAIMSSVSGANVSPKKKKKRDDDESSTSSEDTHLDECEICDDGGGE